MPEALDEIQIQDLIESVIDKRKPKWQYRVYEIFKKDPKIKVDELPEFYPAYKPAVEMALQNRCHAEKGVFPTSLFLEKSPYQKQEEFDYIKGNYKQVTLEYGVDYIATTSRAFNDGNYSIKYAEDDATYKDDSLQKYLETGINVFGSLELYMKSLIPTIKGIDAMGVICIRPDFIFETNTEGERIISPTELNEPQPVYYESYRVVGFKEEDYCIIETTGEHHKDGIFTFEIYDRMNIWHVEYDSLSTKNKNEKFKIALYYAHDWEQLPVQRLKGIPRLVNGEILWQSPLSFAADILDIIAIDNSTLNISKFKCAFPTRVMDGRPCLFEYKDSEGQVTICGGSGLVHDSSLGRNIVCPGCNGLGQVDRFSPARDYIVNTGDRLDPEKRSSGKPFYYESPDPAILEYLENAIAKNDAKARKFLHLHTSNSQVTGSEDMTVTGMSLDNKAMYAFIKPISDQMFELWGFIIDAVGWMRYGSDYKKPAIKKPFSFDFKTEYDYINEISAASKAGLPPVMIHTIIINYLKSHFYSENQTSKVFDLIIATDRLIGLSNDEIAFEMNKGLVAGWEVVIHTSGITLINNLVNADEGFLDKEISVQRDALIASAKAIETANKPPSPTQDIINSVLGKTNGNVPATV